MTQDVVTQYGLIIPVKSENGSPLAQQILQNCSEDMEKPLLGSEKQDAQHPKDLTSTPIPTNASGIWTKKEIKQTALGC